MVESPNLRRVSHAQCFGILKKLTFLQEELFGHTFININKQLNWNVVQYTILCLQSILSVYLIINY